MYLAGGPRLQKMHSRSCPQTPIEGAWSGDHLFDRANCIQIALGVDCAIRIADR